MIAKAVTALGLVVSNFEDIGGDVLDSRQNRKAWPSSMAGSKRVLNAKSDKFQGNIHKRGKVPDVSPKSSSKVAVGPIMLGFFLFVVVGSALLQIIRTATSGAML